MKKDKFTKILDIECSLINNIVPYLEIGNFSILNYSYYYLLKHLPKYIEDFGKSCFFGTDRSSRPMGNYLLIHNFTSEFRDD